VILTDRDPIAGREPLVRRRLINILGVLEGDVDHDDMDTCGILSPCGPNSFTYGVKFVPPMEHTVIPSISRGMPLVRRRLINILGVLEGDVDHDDMDTDEVIARAGEYG
jgi:hypothetical protein